MSAIFTRLGQLEAKFGFPAREYHTARDFGGNFTYESRSRCLSIFVFVFVSLLTIRMSIKVYIT